MFAVLAGCSSDGTDGTSMVEVPFTAANGSSLRLADLQGTPVVVNLWATWCTPCITEMPAFDVVAAELTGSVRVIGVNVGDSAADAVAFAADLGVRYDLFTDPDGALMTALEVTGLPATAFVADDGTLVTLHQGALTAEELRAAVEQAFPNVASGVTSP